MTRRRHTLRTRTVLVMMLVATIAVLVTGLTSLQLVRSGTVEDARRQLAAQSELLSRLPLDSVGRVAAERVQLAIGDADVTIVSSDGSVTGATEGILRPTVVRQLLRGHDVSLARRTVAGTVFIEGRPLAGGGAVVLSTTQARVDSTSLEAFRRILIGLAIGLSVALLAGALLALWLSRPLTAVAGSARRLAHGERSIDIPRGAPAEVADVSDALSSLADALRTSEARQREFLLSISHEMRTPLTALRGYGEALADGMIAPDDTAKVGATLVTETERLDRFVADLLELARLEADDFTIVPGPADAATICRDAVAAWAGHAAKLSVPLLLELGAETLPLTTDARRTRQLLDGLIENALRVTPVGGTCVVAARRMESTVLLEVRDSGPGLSTDEQAVAFDRGALGGRYRGIRPVGTGLGLSIAARLATRLGGSIAVSSAPEGGAAFSVSLPD